MMIKWDTKKNIKYGIRLEWTGKIWNASFLPTWHNKRGYYISLGFLFIAFYRGY
jgi:hypothetical protein